MVSASWLAEAARAARAARPAAPRLPCSAGSRRKFATSQVARTLATLLGGGIPLVNALDIAARSIDQPVHGARAREAAQQVREGRELAAAMHERGVFPDVAIKMVEVGESTGALQEMLNSLADFYDEEIETELAGSSRWSSRSCSS